jgi:hypothetical protein
VYSSVPVGARWLEGALIGVGAGAVGISLVMLARLAPSAAKSNGGWWLALVAFVMNGILHVSILWVLLALLPLGIWLNWERSRTDPPPSRIPPSKIEEGSSDD